MQPTRRIRIAKTLASRRIGIVLFDQVTLLDVAGAADVFACANDYLDGANRYDVVTLATSLAPVLAASGVLLTAQQRLSPTARIDTLIVPGGSGIREPRQLAAISVWIKSRHRSFRRIVSVCTGIYALAEAGLLDGLSATTHWRHAANVAARYPRIRIDADAIFLREGRIATSAGITAGIDLCLALVEEDHGPDLALKVARDLVVFMKRPGGQAQFSEPLEFQTQARDRVGEIAGWIGAHLRADLRVETLAARVHLSRRQLSRRVQAHFGLRPADLVESLRLGEARRRLLAGKEPIERIARSVGYVSADAFRRAFQRAFGVAPTRYREQFSSTSGPDTAADARATHSQRRK